MEGLGLKIVGVISDTHIPTRAKAIPTRVFEFFRGVDLIVHAGDLVQLKVLEELGRVAPVIAVCGNMDQGEVVERLPRINSVEIYDRKIGVIHDPGVLLGMDRVVRLARRHDFDVLIFGHTHSPLLKEISQILFLNPGSPTNPLPPFLTKPSVGLLKIDKEAIDPQIINM